MHYISDQLIEVPIYIVYNLSVSLNIMTIIKKNALSMPISMQLDSTPVSEANPLFKVPSHYNYLKSLVFTE